MTGKEKQGTREALSILSESLEDLGGPRREGEATDDATANSNEEVKSTDQETTDISKLLKEEINDLKDKKKMDFITKDLGLPSVTYLHCNFDSPSPSDLVYHALDNVRRTQQNKSRFCWRFFPVDYTTSSELDAMKALGKQVAEERFTDAQMKEMDVKTFSVDVEFRVKPPQLKRLDAIEAFAEPVAQPPWKVDLNSPDVTVMVNIVKGSCGVAVLKEYRALKRYNLSLIASSSSTDAEDEET